MLAPSRIRTRDEAISLAEILAELDFIMAEFALLP
jgi:hypothetical protein